MKARLTAPRARRIPRRILRALALLRMPLVVVVAAGVVVAGCSLRRAVAIPPRGEALSKMRGGVEAPPRAVIEPPLAVRGVRYRADGMPPIDDAPSSAAMPPPPLAVATTVAPNTSSSSIAPSPDAPRALPTPPTGSKSGIASKEYVASVAEVPATTRWQRWAAHTMSAACV